MSELTSTVRAETAKGGSLELETLSLYPPSHADLDSATFTVKVDQPTAKGEISYWVTKPNGALFSLHVRGNEDLSQVDTNVDVGASRLLRGDRSGEITVYEKTLINGKKIREIYFSWDQDGHPLQLNAVIQNGKEYDSISAEPDSEFGGALIQYVRNIDFEPPCELPH